MEDGTAATRGGNGDRRDRRRTVSGAIPQVLDERRDLVTPFEDMRFPWSSPSAPTSPTSTTAPVQVPMVSRKNSAHKRTFSGSILAKFHFLRNSGEDGRPPSRGEWPASRDKEQTSPTKSIFSRKSVEDDVPPISPTSPKTEKENALAAALKQNKTRKRKGSLRKTALLGGRRITSEGRERKGSFSLLQRSPEARHAQQQAWQHQSLPDEPLKSAAEDPIHPSVPAELDSRPQSLRRQFSYEKADAASSSDSGWSEPAAVSAARLSLLTEHQDKSQPGGPTTTVDELGSPLDVKSPTSQTSNPSTTDDDDVLTFDRPAKTLPQQPGPALNGPMSSAATSYFPSPSATASLPIARRRSSKRSSPLSHSIPMSAAGATPEPHDYTETEYWGWVILFVTWLTFTVGMGSCLEIWSWAWDVGETPYAPPELEDDDTLPIVGYYPALMVLTGVVAWVWITVAWVGMKYFRHAKIEV